MPAHTEPLDLTDLMDLTDLTRLSDRDLLLGGRSHVIAENRAGAQRWARLVEFFRRREREHPARKARSPHFALTARQETVVEVGELWGMSETWVRKQLNVALCLAEHFPSSGSSASPAAWTPTAPPWSPTPPGSTSTIPRSTSGSPDASLPSCASTCGPSRARISRRW